MVMLVSYLRHAFREGYTRALRTGERLLHLSRRHHSNRCDK